MHFGIGVVHHKTLSAAMGGSTRSEIAKATGRIVRLNHDIAPKPKPVGDGH